MIVAHSNVALFDFDLDGTITERDTFLDWHLRAPRRLGTACVWVFVVEDAATLTRLRAWGVAGCVTTRLAELAAALAPF